MDVERRKAYELKRALEAVPNTIWVRIVWPHSAADAMQWPNQLEPVGRRITGRGSDSAICTCGPKQKTESCGVSQVRSLLRSSGKWGSETDLKDWADGPAERHQLLDWAEMSVH